MNIIIAFAYLAFFVFLIYKLKFFRIDGLSHKFICLLFFVKILCGYCLVWVYTYYYKDRSTADIYKYFDDSKAIFDSLLVNPKHFLQLVFGIHPDAEYLQIYTQKSINWAHQTNEYVNFLSVTDYDFFDSTRMMIKLNAVLRIISFGNYHVHLLFFCFLSLTGLTCIYKAFKSYFFDKKTEFIICVFFIPSSLFWCSGVLKESLLIFSVGLLVYNLMAMTDKGFTFKNLLGIVISLFFMLIMKYNYLLSLIPAITAFAWVAVTNNKRVLIKYVSVCMMLLLMIFMAVKFFPSYNPFYILAEKQKEQIKIGRGGEYYIRTHSNITDTLFFDMNEKIVEKPINEKKKIVQIVSDVCGYKFTKGEIGDKVFITAGDTDKQVFKKMLVFPRAGSYIEMSRLKPDFRSFIKGLPNALINIFLRPHIFEAESSLILLAALENTLIFLILLLCLSFTKINKSHLNILLFLIIWVFSIMILAGLTTPVLGTLVRLKAPIIPLFLITLLLIFNKKKFMEIIDRFM